MTVDHFYGAVKNRTMMAFGNFERWKSEMARLFYSMMWFTFCASCMAFVQINGDSMFADYQASSAMRLESTSHIRDMFFELLPIIRTISVVNPDFILHLFITTSLISGLYQWGPLLLVAKVRRYFWIYGTGYLLRMCTLAFTVMPPSNPACVPLRRTFLESLFITPHLLLSHVHTCTDKIFSGHTLVATLLLCFWFEASNDFRWRGYALFSWCSMVSTSLMGRCHYTVDITVAFIVAMLIYWVYRLLLMIGELTRQCPDLYLSKKVAHLYPIISLICWCDGLDLAYSTDNPFDSLEPGV